MWRAEVVERHSEHRVTVIIPALYRFSRVGPIQSSVDAVAGSRVVVADLTPGAKVHDWWVVGFESQVGQWAETAPHTHPLGQVEGLVDALATKADRSELPTPTAPPSWVKVPLATGWIDRTTGYGEPGMGLSAGMWVRRTPEGIHLRVSAEAPDAAAYGTTIATLPATHLPAWTVTVPALVGLVSEHSNWTTAAVQFDAATGRVALNQFTAPTANSVAINTVLPTP